MFGEFDLVVFLRDILQNFGLGKSLSVLLVSLIMVILVVFLSWLAYIIARFFINRIVTVVVRKSKFKWDDIFLDNKVFTRLSHFAPAVVIYMMAGLALDPYPGWLDFVQKLTYLYMIIAGMLFLFSFVNAWHKIYQTLPIAEHRHIKGYLQLLNIFIGFIALLIVISVIFNKDLTTLVAGLGAMAAVLLLIFKDTILGLVASVQLSANNMVRIGDWISMPSRGADGTVLDITLNTVKVENFDKTIVTVPTYSLVQESFQNWSGMERSGGRRIKRAVHIDVRSVKFLDKEQIDGFRKIQILRDYIDNKEKDLENFNKEHNIDDSVLVNGRRMTNVGTFRAYINAYLKQHPKIHNDMTFLVRQLPVSEKGLPIEIYVFSKVQEWAKYEAIQADIFDHLLAVVPEFGLRIFQNPTGNDFQQLRN
ncbi:MAG: mechanosensitive ion channel domain-containing protein [Bacteroidales bacterium]|jgi:miniconductance mechanosensitive channel|nr:mechanosensitive ion channel domain-containing protein [Bacteroidales bacterium]